MGVSTDAMLFYGYHLPEDTELSEEAQETYYSDEPVQMGTHCSDEFPMYYIFVKESQTVAYRGYPQKVTSLDIGTGWDELLYAFIKKHDIPQPGTATEYDETSNIGWWLASYWG